ncbi:MAG: type II toxin-antitoxin system antitoxin SocA domain-containing protein [Flavobacteriales bacterium]
MKKQSTSNVPVIFREIRKMEFRKEEFEICFHFHKDEKRQYQYTTTELDEINYTQLLNKYRSKHNLPFPEEIKGIREKYQLSAAKMSEILGLGVNSFRQYEAGEVPSTSIGKLIQMSADPIKFKELINLCDSIDEDTRSKIITRINDHVGSGEGDLQWIKIDDYFAGHIRPSEFTGYRKPNLERFAHMIIRFSEKLSPWKTQLNKLLFYADFLHYKRYATSISGCQYAAIQMGPVPKRFETVFDELATKDYFDVWYTQFQDGNYGEQFKARNDHPFDSTLFSEQELATMDQVIESLGKLKRPVLVEISHKEKGWIDNHESKGLIEYGYAFDLKAI